MPIPKVASVDSKIIAVLQRSFLPAARLSMFVVYFWFGLLKLLDLSPASPLAALLTSKTIGAAHFDVAFNILALFECAIGILFLFPKAIRLVIPLLVFHLIIVCSPLVLVPGAVWDKPFVPSLEGQYIIKNVILAALAVGIAAHTKPLKP